ncbi:MAG TPA: tRNA-(ms[2]io[6]A)-hydroxylase [Catalimonadaceae bacterium]|nr:tRNA-(ms[2]io[6]A)-hydroxylase [Catalimonadaceae bacterium]
MKVSLDLKNDSPKAWTDAVMADFPKFLMDHANCERKASAMAMSLVAKYPDRHFIIKPLIETAIEELEHFRDVVAWMDKLGVSLSQDMQPDPYVNQLIAQVRKGRDEGLIDRLCLGSIIECRGAERFRLVEERLEEGELKRFYKILWASEAKHGNIFVELALHYFDKKLVYSRLEELLEIESKIIDELEIRSALH